MKAQTQQQQKNFHPAAMAMTARAVQESESLRSIGTVITVREGEEIFAEGDDTDPLELIESEAGTTAAESSADKVERSQMLEILEREIEKLPTRQREAFLMRYWEEMDVAETAAAMGCSEGSVKTHCFRAIQTLSKALKAKGIEP